MRFGLAFVALLLASPALSQSAQEAAMQAALNELIPAPDSKRVAAAVLQQLQDDAGKAGACVATGVTLGPIKPASATRTAIEGLAQHAIRNMWTVSGTPQGCPSPAPVRFIVVLLGDDSLLVRPFATGESIAWVSLVMDARSSVAVSTLATMTVKNPSWGCSAKDPISLKSVAMAGEPKDVGPDFYGVRYTGSWQEIWTFEMCKRAVAVPIAFTADGNGGATWNATLGVLNPS
jgi:hypothetical protein